VVQANQHIIEIVSDSGEGAQKAGQTFGVICAKAGNGVWTVEIIPAEIKPPARSRPGASGIRIRVGTHAVTNMGDHADLVVAFNEQVPYGRIEQDAYRPGTVMLLESMWRTSALPEIRTQYAEALAEFRALGLDVRELPLDEECRKITANPRLGKNMFVLGMLVGIYGKDLDIAKNEVRTLFARKGAEVVQTNHALLEAGFTYARDQLDLHVDVPAHAVDHRRVVMNGNQALGLGVMASGMEMVAMYPITPATSASHYLAAAFPQTGGFVHQAEDEIAAIGFAIGASYAGRTACTITSGPGLALKTEFLGLAVMAEVPLVIAVVQRGGPSTGLPTKVEQGDLLAALFGAPGDAPKVVLAASTIEECFHLVVLSRQLAEAFRTPVLLLTDANLGTGVSPFRYPEIEESWFAEPLDLSDWDDTVPPYAWDTETGLSPRPIPGQRGGEYVLTGLAHTEHSKVAYDPDSNQRSCEMRSKKLHALQKSLRPPEVYGALKGKLLLVGWGSTRGSIEEAVDRARIEGHEVSAVHLRFLSPLEPGLAEIFAQFDQVCTVEINFSDPPGTPHRRFAQLCWVLRAELLIDIDCWSMVHGQPIRPSSVHDEIVRRLS
jgi:2-oxoglutarate/2-oxoacid ferredoxin oxidoreductase subunit alpha